MPKANFNYLYKNFEQYLKRPPQEKMSFLENTLLKRKSLINKSSKRYKAIQKRKEIKKSSIKHSTQSTLKCPVYACFKEMRDDEQLMKHYAEAHQDLKSMGLDLVLDNQGSLASGGVRTNVKGKVHNNLLTQAMIVTIVHKNQIKEMLTELNEEFPPPEA